MRRAVLAALAAAATADGVLQLTAGIGPWAWRVARYDLLEGRLDIHEQSTTYSADSVRRLRKLGSVWRTQSLEHTGEHPDLQQSMTFNFDRNGSELPLELALTTHDQAGVGSQVWESAIVQALFQRSELAPLLPPNARILELGAGVGLPGFDMARRSSSVTLTDSEPRILEMLRSNELSTRQQHAVASHPFGHVHVAGLNWGDKSSGIGTSAESFDCIIGVRVPYAVGVSSSLSLQPKSAHTAHCLGRYELPLTTTSDRCARRVIFAMRRRAYRFSRAYL
jgi:hypothetical protein